MTPCGGAGGEKGARALVGEGGAPPCQAGREGRREGSAGRDRGGGRSRSSSSRGGGGGCRQLSAPAPPAPTTAALPAPCGKHWVRRRADALLSRFPSLSPVLSPPQKKALFLPPFRPPIADILLRPPPRPGLRGPAAPASAAHIARAAAPSGERGEPPGPGPVGRDSGRVYLGVGAWGVQFLSLFIRRCANNKRRRGPPGPPAVPPLTAGPVLPRAQGGVDFWEAVFGRFVSCAQRSAAGRGMCLRMGIGLALSPFPLPAPFGAAAGAALGGSGQSGLRRLRPVAPGVRRFVCAAPGFGAVPLPVRSWWKARRGQVSFGLCT